MSNAKFTPGFISTLIGDSKAVYVKYDTIRIDLKNKPRVEFILNDETIAYLDLPAINKGDTVTLSNLIGFTSMRVS